MLKDVITKAQPSRRGPHECHTWGPRGRVVSTETAGPSEHQRESERSSGCRSGNASKG